MFLGGHTVTLGNFISVIGLVSIVVLIGLSAQELNDWHIMVKAPVNPEMTTRIQKNLTNFLVVEMCIKPCIVEDSKYVLMPSIVSLEMLIMLLDIYCACNEEQMCTHNSKSTKNLSEPFK